MPYFELLVCELAVWQILKVQNEVVNKGRGMRSRCGITSLPLASVGVSLIPCCNRSLRIPGGSVGLCALPGCSPLHGQGLKALVRVPSGMGKLFVDVQSALLPLHLLRTSVADRQHLIKSK